ncbi:hypothetical protein Q5762_13775 [Streptomyces sp. P9(2023)]|uniref:hypothetical protein n=1 Tax=Streptomyces sp. P9(2023) TaxID=3064394 RepID=UPI0028F44847|nr:hypothetical protein [Streptomyces sp. P9(2023)]MDT9689385.1 hypothetical protein [Streptomyces sp. P9(2023)]
MIVVYTPPFDGEPEHFDARSLRVSEVAILTRSIDQTWKEIQAGLGEQDLVAMCGVAWVIKKRSQPSLRLADFDPGVEELSTRLDRDEVERWAEATAEIAWQDADATPEKLLAAMRIIPAAALDREHAEAVVERLAKAPKDEAHPAPQSNGTTGPTETSSS